MVNLNVEAKTAELMDERCKTVKDWRRLQAREEKRKEAKLAKSAAKEGGAIKQAEQMKSGVAARPPHARFQTTILGVYLPPTEQLFLTLRAEVALTKISTRGLALSRGWSDECRG